MNLPRRLLLVEDDPAYRALVRRALEPLRVELREAATLAEARQQLEQGDFDLVLADVRLPDGSGLDLFPGPLDVPVVFLTGDPRSTHQSQALELGAEDFLLKPQLGPRSILEAVRKAIARHHARARLMNAHESLSRRNEELEHAAERDRESFDQSPLGYILLDRAGRVIELNEAMVALLASPRRVILGMPLAARLARASIRVFLAHLWRCFRSVEAEEVDVCMLRAGQEFPVRLSSRRISSEVLRCMVLDLSEQAQVREALHLSQITARALQHSLRELVITVDSAGRIVAANVAVAQLLGKPAEEVIGRPVHSLFPSLVLASGRMELQGRGRDDDPFPAEVTITPLATHPPMFVLVARDLTEEWQLAGKLINVAEAERRRLGQELHDNLGQRLTAVSYLASALLQRLQGADSGTLDLVRRLADMTNQAVSETRALARGLFPAELEGAGLVSALRQLAHATEQVYPVECRVEGDPVAVDPGQASVHLYRIAQEAISNAVRHGRARRVWMRFEHDGRRALLRIEDDGVGYTQRSEGLHGLGVISMRHHARLLGGALEIDSRDGGGTAVTCLLPPDKKAPGARSGGRKRRGRRTA